MYVTGAGVLESIPDSVRAHTNVEFSALPRILASCDGIVTDSSTGKAAIVAVSLPAQDTTKV